MAYFVPAVSVVFGLLAIFCGALAESANNDKKSVAATLSIIGIAFMAASIYAAFLWGQMP